MARGRHDAGAMESTSANVMLFAFHDATQAAQVSAAAGARPGVRSVAVVARSADCEIRIISRVGDELPDAHWLASTLAVLDALSGPLRVQDGSSEPTEAVTLPDSPDGFAAFGRLIRRGTVVILVAVCDDAALPIDSFVKPLGAALFQMPVDYATRT